MHFLTPAPNFRGGGADLPPRPGLPEPLLVVCWSNGPKLCSCPGNRGCVSRNRIKRLTHARRSYLISAQCVTGFSAGVRAGEGEAPAERGEGEGDIFVSFRDDISGYTSCIGCHSRRLSVATANGYIDIARAPGRRCQIILALASDG